MKLHYIAIQPFGSGLLQIIQAEEVRFRAQNPIQLLCFWEEHLKVLLKEAQTDRQKMQQLRDNIAEICNTVNEMQFSYPCMNQLTAIIQETDGNVVYKAIKQLRQEYWLAWLEDIFCEQIESALERCLINRTGDPVERLYIITLPEFVFSDSGIRSTGGEYKYGYHPYKAFYKRVVRKFLQGMLPSDMPRTTLPIRRFTRLSRDVRYNNGTKKLLIFAGTIIGKAGKSEEKPDAAGILRSVYYNMAPVFFEGSCIQLWEKQEISDADRKNYEPQHKHHVEFGKQKDLGATGKDYTASVFSDLELSTLQLTPVNPVFEINPFHQGLAGRIRFAMSICKDYEAPDIIGNIPVDVMVLLAFGMRMEGSLETIGGARFFCYCDGGRQGSAFIKLGDSLFWPEPKPALGCTWTNIDVSAVRAHCYLPLYSPRLPGVYIASNIEDFP